MYLSLAEFVETDLLKPEEEITPTTLDDQGFISYVVGLKDRIYFVKSQYDGTWTQATLLQHVRDEDGDSIVVQLAGYQDHPNHYKVNERIKVRIYKLEFA